jgi:hypothetical protein
MMIQSAQRRNETMDPDSFVDDMEMPRDGDSIFALGQADWQNNACLNICGRTGPANLWAYETGYKLAGDVLSGYVLSTGGDQDVLVYPIMFLYRHYLELRLKQLVYEGTQLLGNVSEYPHGHRLVELWSRCRPILAKVYAHDDTADLDRAGKVIQEIDAYDGKGEAFRYSFKGDTNYLEDLTHIHLRNAAEVMGRLGNMLDAASCGIVQKLDEKHEMEAALYE